MDDTHTKEHIREEKGARVRKGLKILKIVIFIGILAGIPLTLFVSYPDIGLLLTDQAALTAFLEANEGQNSIFYIIIMVVIVVIGVPIGQVVNFAGVFIFGIAVTYLLSIVGIIIGMFVAFFIARYLGKDFVTMVFKEKNVGKFTSMMNTSKAYVVTVVIFLIPGFPKDIFTYAAGLSNVRVLLFVLTAAVARSPAIFATLLLAEFARQGDYIGMGAVVATVAACLVLIFFKRKKIFAYIEAVHERFRGA
ncbi:MAG: VTT domain-containing protein [Clostridiales bacterium]|nr:VTT domain-containing protein [Clostridiales bacterium]